MTLHIGTPIPPITGVTEWINGTPELDSLKGHPVLLLFWSVSCHVCSEMMPKVNALRDLYAPKGLQTIAIHIPRQESETDIEVIRKAIAHKGITEPCGVDNKMDVNELFQNEYVPSFFLFNSEGLLRNRGVGLNGLQVIETALKRLL